MENEVQQPQDDNMLITDMSNKNDLADEGSTKNLIKNGKKKRWIIVGTIVSIITITGIIIGLLVANGIKREVTICTEMDYHGDIGPCIEKKTVEIVSTPDNSDECPTNTEPVYDVVGGIVGVRFVGCAKK